MNDINKKSDNNNTINETVFIKCITEGNSLKNFRNNIDLPT